MAKPPRLRYLADTNRGITRRRRGNGFSYFGVGGSNLRNARVLARIRSLVVPPAWTDVWISPVTNSHLQATGRDVRGRKQYIYHPAFRAHQEEQKFERLAAFAALLPKIRAKVRADLGKAGLPREKVLATVVHLLEKTHIRIGNEDYARTNKSYGLTTLRSPHVEVTGSALRFKFTGKSGKAWRLKITDRRVASVVKACQDLPGQHLFQYYDDAGGVRDITSSDVNAYLRDCVAADVTAKDFRTWWGTVLAVRALQEAPTFTSEAEAKRNVRDSIAAVADKLGNTVAICRKCYVHSQVIEDYLAGKLATTLEGARYRRGLEWEEAGLARLLTRRRSVKSAGSQLRGSRRAVDVASLRVHAVALATKAA
jgi:DNA topoisomerase-1